MSASPTRVFKATIRHYAFLFDSEKQRQLNFSCGINEFIAYFITNSLSFSQTNPKATLCGDQLEFPIFTIGQNPLLNNFFRMNLDLYCESIHVMSCQMAIILE